MSAIVLATFISQRIAPKGTIYTLGAAPAPTRSPSQT